MVEGRKKIPVIIDTDPGVDDTVAILLALSSPEIEILAYVITFGNTDVSASYANIFKIYQAVGKHIEKHPESRSRFPNFDPARKPLLLKGPSGPLAGELHSAKYFHGRDGLGNMSEVHPDLNVPQSVIDSPSHPQLQPDSRPAHEASLALLREFPAREITYLPLGPMTNLALMMRSDAKTVRERIGRVVAMGGALDVPGNTSPVAEFNFFADPYAVQELLHPSPDGLHQGLPLSRMLLLPLDITTNHELSFPFYQNRVDPSFSRETPSSPEGKPPLTHFTSAFFRRTREVMLTFGKDAMELHDVAAIWAAAENPPVKDAVADAALGLTAGWGIMQRKFQMERTGELTRGMCVVDHRDDVGAYAPGANRAAVQAALESQHIKHAQFESTAVPALVEVEEKPVKEPETEGGVPIVTGTPGSAKLVEVMLRRIWGVDV